MLRCLLWNTQRKPLDGLILRLVKEHDLNVLILVEHPTHNPDFERILAQFGKWRAIECHERFGFYVKINRSRVERVKPVTESDRVDYFRLGRAANPEVLLVLVHGFDRRNYSDGERRMFFERLTENVLTIESRIGHKRTLVAGDFNANPYDSAVGSVQGLHAVNMREIHGRRDRTVLSRNYEFFYNPMWACYGSGLTRPPASYYYYKQGEEHAIFWHMLDQIVLRPDAVEVFDEKRLRILTEAGGVSLLTKRGIPDEKSASDHLPILFQLRI